MSQQPQAQGGGGGVVPEGMIDVLEGLDVSDLSDT